MSVYTGRYKNETCPKNDPNHAMVLCGFGSDKFGDYWLIRYKLINIIYLEIFTFISNTKFTETRGVLIGEKM